jgi:hypothetical protein
MTRRAELLSSTALPEDMELVLRVLDSLFSADPTISGATLFTPDGDVKFFDAATMRQGGAA